MCKVLENRSQQDEERMDQLTNQLKEARLLAEDADGKSDEVRLHSINYSIIIPWSVLLVNHNYNRIFCGSKFELNVNRVLQIYIEDLIELKVQNRIQITWIQMRMKCSKFGG